MPRRSASRTAAPSAHTPQMSSRLAFSSEQMHLLRMRDGTLEFFRVLRVIVASASPKALSSWILRPLEPALDPTQDALILRPKIAIRHATADGELGGRLQLDAQFGDRFGLLMGVGARQVGRLEAGGDAWADGRAPTQVCVDADSVPCFEPNGRSQVGTGYDEITADARAAQQADGDDRAADRRPAHGRLPAGRV